MCLLGRVRRLSSQTWVHGVTNIRKSIANAHVLGYATMPIYVFVEYVIEENLKEIFEQAKEQGGDRKKQKYKIYKSVSITTS